MQEDQKFSQALKIQNAKVRLKNILDACKNKTKCEHGDELEVQGEDFEVPIKKSHGGCGFQQPKLTIEGMNMIAEYKEKSEKNETLTAERVIHSRSKILLSSF